MSTVPRAPSVEKLLTMVDNTVIRNRVYDKVHHSDDKTERDTQYGRLRKSIHELQETAEHFRKAGQP